MVKSAAKKSVADKSTAKKSTAVRRQAKVKMIQSVDARPGKDTVVIFTDGTKALVKSGNKLSAMLVRPENVAPNMIQVTMQGKNIVDARSIDVDKGTVEE